MNDPVAGDAVAGEVVAGDHTAGDPAAGDRGPGRAVPDLVVPDLAATGRAAADRVVLRPRKVRIAAWISAVVIVVLFVAIALILRNSPTGVFFRLADQVALVVVGVFAAAGVLMLARPRVRADADGIEVRNVVVKRYFPWAVVERVAFPDSTPWARLDLADDEYIGVMAVQAVDGARAVDGIRALRALHATARAR